MLHCWASKRQKYEEKKNKEALSAKEEEINLLKDGFKEKSRKQEELITSLRGECSKKEEDLRQKRMKLQNLKHLKKKRME